MLFRLLLTIHVLAVAMLAGAADFETIGVAPLRREQPGLTGAGIPVGQSEAPYPGNLFEVNPADPGVSQPTSLFTWISSSGTATTFPNSAGGESPHADTVAARFFGTVSGVAPGVAHVRNYEAGFYSSLVVSPGLIEPEVVMNNSWVGGVDSSLESAFDNYAAGRNILFVSGMANDTATPQAPGSCYNGIGVGRSEGPSSVGPTADGRSKPDIVVPGGDATSFVTPQVSGAAALLWQAAARNDAGANTAGIATNSVVIKSLLLNGAVKPSGWTNGTTRPLDARWGAGNLNVYLSWLLLRGGRAPYSESISVQSGDPHPPTVGTSGISKLRGWDYTSVSSSPVQDGVNHYYFQIPTNGGRFLATATLVWKRAAGANAARNLDLFLYNANSGGLVLASRSSVDNVEHLFATNLPPGRYDLQVLKQGGQISESGTQSYALSWDFVSPSMQIARTNGNVIVSWPVNQAGLVLQSTPSLTTPITWQTLTTTSFVSNARNTVTVPVGNGTQYFRLTQP